MRESGIWCQHFFSGSVFAGDKNVGIGACYLDDHFHELLHGGRLTDNHLRLMT